MSKGKNYLNSVLIAGSTGEKKYENIHLTKFLIWLGADVNFKSKSMGMASVLYMAALYGQPERVKYLIEKGADVKNAPLRLAFNTAEVKVAYFKRREIAKTLLNNGAEKEDSVLMRIEGTEMENWFNSNMEFNQEYKKEEYDKDYEEYRQKVSLLKLRHILGMLFVLTIYLSILTFSYMGVFMKNTFKAILNRL